MATHDGTYLDLITGFASSGPLGAGASATLLELKSGAGAIDGTPPTVTVISPPVGVIPGSHKAAANTPVIFEVTDIAPGLGFLRVRIRYTRTGQQCTVHNGSTFEFGFAKNSTKTAIANGFRFSIRADGGWLSAFDIEVDAIDAHGNIAT